jgi:hypothetical protein
VQISLAGEVVLAASKEVKTGSKAGWQWGWAAPEVIASQYVNALLGSGKRSMKFEIAELVRIPNGAVQRLRLLIKERGRVEACRTSDNLKLERDPWGEVGVELPFVGSLAMDRLP